MKDSILRLACAALCAFALPFAALGQWVPHANTASYHLYAIDVASNDVAYTGGYGGSLVKTTDAGQSWSALNTGDSDWVSGIHFFDEQHGWICTQASSLLDSGSLKETFDGGQTWAKRNSGGNFLDMSWPTNSVGYAVAWDGIMVKTTDGGQSWNTVPIPTNQNLGQIQFLDANSGYVMSVGNRLYRTTDGGANWTTLVLPSIEVFYFMDMNNGWIGDYYGKIGKTTDGAATFTFTQTLYDFTYRSIAFADQNTGYIVGGLDCSSSVCTQSPSLLTTTDGGQTWVDNSHPFVGQTKGFYEIDLAPNGMPFVCGSHSIIMTNPSKVTGIRSEELAQLNIYPNPAREKAHVELPYGAEELQVYNALGALVHAEQVGAENTIELDMDAWKSGIYFVRVMASDRSLLAQQRFMKAQ